jgi:uncharacterized membrane protein YbhN (UPF0104 family)
LEKTRRKSALKFIFKLLLSGAAIYLVFSKIELKEVWLVIQSSNWLWLFVSLVLFNLSKWCSAIRLHKLFMLAGVNISQFYNLRLYYIGMFYNLFLPGGIGGDGYKVLHLRKMSDATSRKLLAAVLLDRISGAAMLAFMALVLTFFSPQLLSLIPSFFTWAIGACALLSLPIFALLVYLAFPSFISAILHMLYWSFLVQFVQLVCAFAILSAFGVETYYITYFVLFLISSLAAMLPISFGGVGLRELVFLYAAGFLPIDESVAISLGLVFFLVTALSSFTGVFIRLPDSDDNAILTEKSA